MESHTNPLLLPEIAKRVLSHVSEPFALASATQTCKLWNTLLKAILQERFARGAQSMTLYASSDDGKLHFVSHGKDSIVGDDQDEFPGLRKLGYLPELALILTDSSPWQSDSLYQNLLEMYPNLERGVCQAAAVCSPYSSSEDDAVASICFVPKMPGCTTKWLTFGHVQNAELSKEQLDTIIPPIPGQPLKAVVLPSVHSNHEGQAVLAASIVSHYPDVRVIGGLCQEMEELGSRALAFYGQQLQIVSWGTDADQEDSFAEIAAKRAELPSTFQPLCSFLVTCTGRMQMFLSKPNEATVLHEQFAPAPVMSFFSGGELGIRDTNPGANPNAEAARHNLGLQNKFTLYHALHGFTSFFLCIGLTKESTE
eukprot:TRINITY_DN10746_c0_g1_i3.p1 TRINITY_DN10746_c0_g1~~TRINITY_DN10746_c0_g1_i3.p1  ORF type:complete len:368 (+),score=42.92 TRINITY_DN10746_c0_g1_i3:79-1182(+)